MLFHPFIYSRVQYTSIFVGYFSVIWSLTTVSGSSWNFVTNVEILRNYILTKSLLFLFQFLWIDPKEAVFWAKKFLDLNVCLVEAFAHVDCIRSLQLDERLKYSFAWATIGLKVTVDCQLLLLLHFMISAIIKNLFWFHWWWSVSHLFWTIMNLGSRNEM